LKDSPVNVDQCFEKQYFEINFYNLTFLEKETFNLGNSIILISKYCFSKHWSTFTGLSFKPFGNYIPEQNSKSYY
jgi:hypothetical protein